MFPSKHFLSYLLGFASESEKPLKTRGSKRSEWKILTGVAVLFHERRTRTRAHTHTQFHTQGGEWQTMRSCCYPFSCSHLGPGSREAFKDNTALVAQVPLPCSLLGGGTQPATPGGHTEQFSHMQTARHREPASHVSRKTAVGPLIPAGHIAGQKDWEGTWEKLNDPGLTILFHSTTGTQQVCWTDVRTMALALSCMKEIRSVVVVLGHSQFLPVGSGRV